MPSVIKNKLKQIPLLKNGVQFLESIQLSKSPAYTLYDFFELYIEGIIKGAFTYRAGSVAFSFFMALFPFALFILNLIPYIPLENFQADFLQFVEDSVPPNTYGAIESILIDIMSNSYNSLISTGVIMSMLFMSNGINAILSGFESSYHLTATRNIFQQYVLALLLSVLTSILLLILVAGYLSLELLLHLSDMPQLAIFARYFFILFTVLLVVSILYKFGTKETKHLSFFSFGSVFTTLLIGFTSYVFGIYVLKFAKYNELYGSIGTLLVVMLYIWINCMILLLGFELNATFYRLKKKMYISSN